MLREPSTFRYISIHHTHCRCGVSWSSGTTLLVKLCLSERTAPSSANNKLSNIILCCLWHVHCFPPTYVRDWNTLLQGRPRPLPLIHSVPSYVLFRNSPRNVLGVAEKNHRTISSVPVVYTAGLHDSESGEDHIVPNKTEAKCILLITF
jgi:hypothetical protein